MVAAFETVSKHREEVLWWEFCGLLHDIGKLSSKFLRYRQSWQTTKDGYADKDPHDHFWFRDHDDVLARFPELDRFFHKALMEETELVVKGELSVVNAVHNHITKPDALCQTLGVGDGIDSAYDRNNPLLGCEQTKPEGISYRGNVFGIEKEVRHEELDAERIAFYGKLAELLRLEAGGIAPGWPEEEYERYCEIREAMKASWDRAMSDTTRPNNDTSLWEHAYSVASIAKAHHASKIIAAKSGGPAPDPAAPFVLWGAGFDTLRFVSSSHKVGDVAGRRAAVEEALDRFEKEIEYTLALGNPVYRDDDCVFFVMAPLCSHDLAALEEKLSAECVGQTGGELQPVFAGSKATRELTALPRLLSSLRKEAATPWRGDPEVALTAFDQARSGNGHKPVCPICRLRPATRNQNAICEKCYSRRQTAAKKRDATHSVFSSEIADENGRLALVVARLGLRDWLDGSMVRSLLITEPTGVEQSLEALDRLVDREDLNLGSKVRASLGPAGSYTEMLEGFHKVYDCWKERTEPSEQVKASVLLYGRGIQTVEGPKLGLRAPEKSLWPELATMEAAAGSGTDFERLFQYVCGKTPTPSTLLDVWDTTLEFFREMSSESGWLATELPKKDRLLLRVEQTGSFRSNEALDGTVLGRPVELVHRTAGEFWLLAWKPKEAAELRGKKIVLEDGRGTLTVLKWEISEQVVFPWRVIACSPNQLLLLVPAASALEVTRHLREEYAKQLGKVYGRLPLAVGNVFFPSHTPMFSVLDAARRMERSFRKLQEGPWAQMELEDRWIEELASKLGDGEAEDYHHAYLPLDAEDDSPDFRTVDGALVHHTRAHGRRLRIRPNVYTWVWLGSSAQRFEADTTLGLGGGASAGTKPLDEVLKETRGPRGEGWPYFRLEDVEGRLREFWTEMEKAKVSSSTLRNIAQVYLERAEAWSKVDPEHEGARALALAAAPPGARKALENAMLDGSFAPALQLYLQILKERLQKEATQ